MRPTVSTFDASNLIPRIPERQTGLTQHRVLIQDGTIDVRLFGRVLEQALNALAWRFEFGRQQALHGLWSRLVAVVSSHIVTCSHVDMYSGGTGRCSQHQTLSDWTLAVFLEQVVDRFPQQILRRTIVIESDLFELLRHGRIEMGGDRLMPTRLGTRCPAVVVSIEAPPAAITPVGIRSVPRVAVCNAAARFARLFMLSSSRSLPRQATRVHVYMSTCIAL